MSTPVSSTQPVVHRDLSSQPSIAERLKAKKTAEKTNSVSKKILTMLLVSGIPHNQSPTDKYFETNSEFWIRGEKRVSYTKGPAVPGLLQPRGIFSNLINFAKRDDDAMLSSTVLVRKKSAALWRGK